MTRGFEHGNGFEYPFAIKFNWLAWQFFFSRNGIICVSQLGRKMMAKGKTQKIIQNADINCVFTVLLPGFAAHLIFTSRQIIYKGHLLQK